MADQFRIEFRMAQRLAMYLAFEAMRTLGWCRKPELLLSSLTFMGDMMGEIQYAVRFPLWNDQNTAYEMRVLIERRDDGKCVRGRVWAHHCTCRDDSPMAEFSVDWSEEGIPTVTLGRFEETEFSDYRRI